MIVKRFHGSEGDARCSTVFPQHGQSNFSIKRRAKAVLSVVQQKVRKPYRGTEGGTECSTTKVSKPYGGIECRSKTDSGTACHATTVNEPDRCTACHTTKVSKLYRVIEDGTACRAAKVNEPDHCSVCRTTKVSKLYRGIESGTAMSYNKGEQALLWN